MKIITENPTIQEVIVLKIRRGKSEKHREVTQVFSKSGDFLGENDPAVCAMRPEKLSKRDFDGNITSFCGSDHK
jgi:hypothetical protein